MKITEPCPECGAPIERYRNPYPTADVIIDIDGSIVLVKRKNFPRGWAIPGGFIDYGETAEHAAAREMREETGLDVHDLTLFGVYSDPQRDPRFHTLTIVYTAAADGTPVGGDDAAEAALFTEDTLPDNIVFDHATVLRDYFASRRGK